MRDPQGRLHFDGDRAVRQLAAPHETPAFLAHPASRSLVESGALVPFSISTTRPGRIESPRYDFISLPTEWTDAQLRTAADLTLDVAEAALASGFELKDASAWNVIFDGTVPRFCDHLSFELVRSREWWAFGQFCRHFTFPLACARWRGLPSRAAFQLRRDGLDADQARALLGLRGRFSRLFPLLLRRTSSTQPTADEAVPVVQGVAPGGATLHRSLIDYARRSLVGRRHAANAGESVWSGYVGERQHYSPQAVLAKVAQVQQWLHAIEPRTVLDLGCNTGEFSRLALKFAQRVIAVDADHDCVQRLFLEARGDTRIHPVVADLGDLRGGRGWGAAEFGGLLERLANQADTTLMLALVHHLHVSEGIPLDEIAQLAARLTGRHLIVELLDSDDPMVKRLATQRRRDIGAFTIQGQLDAFGAHFDLVARVRLDDTRRELALMQRRA